MTSPYLNQPQRSLEQLRDELLTKISWGEYTPYGIWQGYCARLRAQLAEVEAAIAERNKP